jgi:signal transduction histidine kinase
MAGLELRINRIISLLLFGILISGIIFPAGLITQIAFSTARISFVNTLAIVIVVSLLAISIYPKFQQWIERNFLDITIKSDALVEDYTSRITTSLGKNSLVNLLTEEIFPSMLIRQAVLLRTERNTEGLDDPYSVEILIQGVQEEKIPKSQNIIEIVKQSGRFIPEPEFEYQDNNLYTWIRLILPLRFKNRLIGVCLFGRRDPDDYYSPSDIQALQAIMNQTALALVNIDQAKHLHSLYQDDIRRHELERLRLARDLHDIVLNDMAIMAQCMDKEEGIEDFDRVYNKSVHHIREIIQNLRPAMLHYGLKPAFDALVDELYMLPARDENDAPLIEVTIPFCQQRYPDEVELHVFRIVQQACENALKHANAKTIRISGRLGEDSIGILVQDDGVGLQFDGAINLEMLLAKQHYGLAGMHERAAIINANIEFLSNEGSGTSVVLIWNKGQAEPLTS